MGALQYISTSALSLTLSGNTGVGPFLTLLIIGIIEKSDPNVLAMEGWVEKLVASWPAIVIFGILTILEFVGKCVPVVDVIIDSVMVWLVPVFSILAGATSWGLFTATSREAATTLYIEEDDHGIRLTGEGAGGAVIFLQVCLCTIGIVLALLVHLCKLLLRLMGEGCCTCCITFCEYAWIMISVTLCVFIVPIAIGAVCCLMVAAGFGFKSWWEKRQKKTREDVAAVPGTENGLRKLSNAEDEEQGKQTTKDILLGEDTAVPSLNPDYVKEAAAKEDNMRQPLLP